MLRSGGDACLETETREPKRWEGKGSEMCIKEAPLNIHVKVYLVVMGSHNQRVKRAAECLLWLPVNITLIMS